MGRWPGRRYDLALVYGHDAALVEYALRVAGRVVAFVAKPSHSAVLAGLAALAALLPGMRNP